MKIVELGQSVSWTSKNIQDITGGLVFLSLHVPEEIGKEFAGKTRELCNTLHSRGCKVIADVSPRTLGAFEAQDFVVLARELHLYALRVDFGLSTEEIAKLAEQIPVAVNASTISIEDARAIAAAGKDLLAIHNFYPRPETGLDKEQFNRKTKALQQLGFKVFAFIPGDTEKRGPLFEGLPTLEEHRYLTPGTAYQILCTKEACDGVFLGDPGISTAERNRIEDFQSSGIISLHCNILKKYNHLEGKPLTCREDSPAGLIRIKESRAYATIGQQVEPQHCEARTRGSITMDNKLYGRYSGEVMISRQNYPQDHKVNVIGHIAEESLPLLDCVENGERFCLIPNKE